MSRGACWRPSAGSTLVIDADGVSSFHLRKGSTWQARGLVHEAVVPLGFCSHAPHPETRQPQSQSLKASMVLFWRAGLALAGDDSAERFAWRHQKALSGRFCRCRHLFRTRRASQSGVEAQARPCEGRESCGISQWICFSSRTMTSEAAGMSLMRASLTVVW